MCKVCAVHDASVIDSINAKTSLDLAHAAQILYSINAEEGKVLAKAAAEYWQAPKADTAEELVDGYAAEPKGDPRNAEASPNIGQAESSNPFEIDADGVVRFRGKGIARVDVYPFGVAFRRV